MKKRDDAKTSFEAVQTMITHPEAQVTALSYESLSGFLFRLDVPHDKSWTPAFLGLNAEGTALTRPVYSLVLKLAMVVSSSREQSHYWKTQDNNHNSLFVHDKFHKKKVELLADFIREADIQQYIYIKTLSPSGKPLCLAVVDMAYFDNPPSQHFLSTLRLSSRSNDVAATAMLEFLQRKLSKNPYVGLGVISMELADGFVPLPRLRHAPEHAHHHAHACEQSLAQLFVLLLNFKIVHWDSHSNNVMATETGDKSCLIDFGRVLDLHRMSSYTSERVARLYLEMQYPLTAASTFFQDLDKIDRWSTLDMWEDAKTKNSSDVVLSKLHFLLLFFARVDLVCNRINMSNNDIQHPQCFHLLKYIYGNQIHWYAGRPIQADADEIWQTRLSRVIPWIQTLTAVPTERTNNTLSSKAVHKLVIQKRIFAIGYDIQLYKQKLQPPAAPTFATPAIVKESESRTTEDRHSSSSSSSSSSGVRVETIPVTSSRRRQLKPSAVKKSSSQRTRKTAMPTYEK